MKNPKKVWMGIIIYGIMCYMLLGQQMPGAKPMPRGVSPQAKPLAKPLSVTQHTITIGGKTIRYSATVGELLVNKPDEQPGAYMFFVAYTRNDIPDSSRRPLTFCFNGGPGSSSVWLHLGGIGPRRVRMTDEGRSVEPPFAMTDNEYSLLDITDLVFIDPVSTGFSRPLPGEDKRQFHGVQEDVASVGEFIRLYVTQNDRWNSPKFVLGESYGTTRAAGLSGFLQGRTHGMYLNGIILVSAVLDFQTIVFQPGSHLPYVLFLPHYTATAWYHRRLPAQLQNRALADVLREAEDFALNEYSVALFKGNSLSEADYAGVVSKLAAYTGLSEDYVRQSNLRIPHNRFVKQLLRDDFRTVGRLDSRFLGRDADAAGESYDFDPSSAAIQGAFSTMLNHYLRTELEYDTDMSYQIYGNVYPWNFTPAPSGPGQMRRGMTTGLNVAETLRQAMAENDFLRVFCCNGFYDGATPYFGTVYQFTQIGLNGEFKNRVKMGFYEAGHMMYIHMPSLVKFKADLTRFYEEADGR
jgi:carboxypeptidase C (cathepsin A)